MTGENALEIETAFFIKYQRLPPLVLQCQRCGMRWKRML